jgi:hypothetical protein
VKPSNLEASMPHAVTLLLLFSGEPTASERALIDAEARKRGAAYIAPAPTLATSYPAYSVERARAIEGRLDEARTLSSSLAEAQALAILAAVERELREHPELPQAAFLLAERHRLAAAIRREQPDGASEAVELDARAFVLEGKRAPAFGQTGSAPDTARALQPTPILFSDVTPRDDLEIDGVSGDALRELMPGEHHVRVLRGDALVFAAYVMTSDGSRSVRLGVPAVVPCSTWDLAPVTAGTKTPAATTSVRCGRWVAVRRMLGRLELAECVAGRCGAFWPLEPPPPPPRPRFPQWASVAIAGVASIGATSLVLWAAGAFDRPVQPARTDVVYRGP